MTAVQIIDVVVSWLAAGGSVWAARDARRSAARAKAARVRAEAARDRVLALRTGR